MKLKLITTSIILCIALSSCTPVLLAGAVGAAIGYKNLKEHDIKF